MLEMGRKRLYGVNRGSDLDPMHAIEVAETSAQWFAFADTAVVDHFDGLVIFNKAMAESPCNEGQVTGIHFRSTTCGEEGPKLAAAAMILQAFGFGKLDEIIRTIKAGGETAHYEFPRWSPPPMVGTVARSRS